ITGLGSNITYYFRAAAQNADGTTYGKVLSVTTSSTATTLLPAPSMITPSQYATNQTTTPNFSWSAVAGASSYRIMVTNDPSALPTDPASATCPVCAVNVTSPSLDYIPPAGYLNPGATYYWQVKSRSTTGFGYWSPPRSFTTAPLASIVLPAPNTTYPSSSATTQSTTPGLSWNLVTGATSYRIMVAHNAADLPVETWSLTCPLCVVNDVAYSPSYSPAMGSLATGTTYYWQVKARSPTSFGAWSVVSRFTTPSTLSDTLPPVDGMLSATPEAGQVALSWSGFSDTGSGIASYKIVSSSVVSLDSCAASVPIYSGTATSFTDTAVVNGTTYYYRVCAVDNAGNVSAGAVASVTPQAVVTPTTGSIRVTIVPQAAANLGAQWRLVGETTWRNSDAAATGLPYNTYAIEFSSVTGWTTPTVQYVPISLVNAVVWVDGGVYIPPVTLGAPSDLQAVVTTAGGVSLSWVDNSSNEAVFLLEQKVGATGIFSVARNLDPNSTAFSIVSGSFVPGQQHCYRMRAYDGLLTYSGYSNEVCVTPSQVPIDPICAGSSPIVGTTAKVAAGFNHTLSLRKDGTVWAWGNNLYGQLGDGNTTDSAVPVQVVGLSGVTAISAGLNKSLALKSDGTVWIWGIYTTARQSNGMAIGTSTPMQVNGLSGVTAIAGGGEHNLALKSDGTVWAWGYNANGQLGNGTSENSDVPVQVTGLAGVSAIAAGYLHSLAMKADGSIWVWGPNGDGALGNGSTAIRQTTPSQVVGLSGVIALAAGYQYTVALKSDGTVWAWGSNVYGQMGTGTASPGVPRTIPAQVAGVSEIVALAAGEGHVLAVKADASVIGWGYNLSGQLGDGSTVTPRPLTPTSGLNSVVQVAAAWNQSFAVKSSGHVCSWGSNTTGQLGSGSTADRAYPAVVLEAEGAGYLNLVEIPPVAIPSPSPTDTAPTTPPTTTPEPSSTTTNATAATKSGGGGGGYSLLLLIAIASLLRRLRFRC
ncbi:MAG: hypothetical protein HY273_06560, partial [Gammaproteobacteria bacterium]|nr:hypothetical protein [Gammaproteobacteria bacterium]